MTKRTTNLLIHWLLLCELYRASSSTHDDLIANGARRPNILLIFADDVGTGDIPVYWNKSPVSMPNLDALAASGTLFLDAHSTPVCAPSRYVLLSGNYQHHGRNQDGTWSLGKASQFLKYQMTIAEVLREGGNYHTAAMGKWHLGGEITRRENTTGDPSTMLLDKANDWSLPIGKGPQDIGFDSSLITSAGIQNSPYAFFRDGYLTTNLSKVVLWKKGHYPMPYGTSMINRKGDGDATWDSTAYNMILVNETEQFLDTHLETRSDDPFFAYVALGSVHAPHSPPDAYLDGSPVAGEYPTKHMDVLSEMDKVVGSLLTLLEDRDLMKDTIVIFASDNGGLDYTKDFSPFRGYKGYVYEGGHRIPLIMRWDGAIQAGVRKEQLIGLNDLFATLCDLAGVAVPSGQAIDSISFVDLLKGSTQASREYLGIWRKGKTHTGEAMRKNEYKLVRTFENSSVSLELFDLSNDIGEQSDLSAEEVYSSLISSMLAELDKVGRCAINKDNNGRFLFKGKKKSCLWASRKSKRCWHKKVRKECPATCGLRTYNCAPLK